MLVALFFVRLAMGFIRRIGILVRRRLALCLARDVIMPLWRTTTTLRPDVRLPPEEQFEFDQLIALSRLTVETHDAPRLIRQDADPPWSPSVSGIPPTLACPPGWCST
ncbi:MAG: hypothetical protein ACRCXL_01530 [Dermatophilaceae bacterium]